VFSHAIETMQNGPGFNPVVMLPKRSLKETERTRWLRWDEYQRLLAACTQDQHRLIIKTAVLTGMRHGEMAALRKGMFLWDRNEVILPVAVTKSSTERVIPLCAELVTELKAHCAKAPKDYVFYHQDDPTQPASPYKAFTRFWHGARRRAKLNDVRFHDLRHTFGSWWVQSGGDIYPLSKVMGHTTTQMTQRYAHLNTEAAHREAQEVFRHIFRHSSEDSEAQEPVTD
jgi:integrase